MEISWAEAVALVDNAGVRCAGEIRALIKQEPACGQPMRLKYRYGESVFRDGRLRWPGDADAPPTHFSADGRCLGLILGNVCEVQDHRLTQPDDHRTVRAPEALLGRGQWLGLFEYFDRLCGIGQISSPDWNITAGSTQLLTLPRVDTDGVRKRRDKLHGDQEDTPRNLFDAVRPIIATEDLGWEVEILFLPLGFLNLLESIALGPQQCALRQALFAQLAITAWASLGKTRHGALYEVLAAFTDTAVKLHRKQGSGGHFSFDRSCLESAARLAAYLVRLNAGAAIAYSVATADDAAGPFGRISELAASWGILPPLVLRPTYLEAGQVGYVRLSDIDPVEFANAGARRPYGKRMRDINAVLVALLNRHPEIELRSEQRGHLEQVKSLLQQAQTWLPPVGDERSHVKKWVIEADGRLSRKELPDEKGFFDASFGDVPSKSPFFTAALSFRR